MDVKRALLEIGLTNGESEVYLILNEYGPCTSGKMLKNSRLASSKVYDVLNKLQQKGLAAFTIKNGVRYYDATPPERLVDFLEAKKQNITQSQKTISRMIPLMKSRKKGISEENNVVVYTGAQGPRIVLKETIEAGRKGEKLMGYGTDEDPYKDYLPADIEDHFRDQKRYGVKWHLLFTKGTWKSPSPLAEIRYLPKGFQLPIRTMIYGNKVAIVDFNEPFTTIIINKKEIADSYRKQFELLWGIAKK